jgi:hypothetical protein
MYRKRSILPVLLLIMTTRRVGQESGIQQHFQDFHCGAAIDQLSDVAYSTSVSQKRPVHAKNVARAGL